MPRGTLASVRECKTGRDGLSSVFQLVLARVVADVEACVCRTKTNG